MFASTQKSSNKDAIEAGQMAIKPTSIEVGLYYIHIQLKDAIGSLKAQPFYFLTNYCRLSE